jgi:hypothetical protein
MVINKCLRSKKEKTCSLDGDSDLCALIDKVPFDRLCKQLDKIAKEETQNMKAGQLFLQNRWGEYSTKV